MRALERCGLRAACLCALVALAASVVAEENYLIVSAPDYVGSAPLEQFIAAKTDMGFVVSVYAPPAGTTNSAIKSHIQSLWGTSESPRYLLIVGDTDGSTSTASTIPHWVGQGSRQATTDLPYACMDGGDDWYPNMYLGRFSVRTVDHLQAIVDKTLQVETGTFPDPEYTKRAALLATSDGTAQAEMNHDWVISHYLEPAEFTTTRIYAAQGGGTSDITAAVNNGALFVVYFGHSSSSGWWEPGFDQSNVQALSNEGLYGLAMGWSCNTAHYDMSECFGETWQRVPNKGAAAYLSASNYVWWGSVDEWDSSRRMERYFFQSIFEDQIWQVGPAWQAALWRILADPDYGPTHDHTRNIFEEMVLLGDPSLRLPALPLRVQLESVIPEFVAPGSPTTLQVRIQSMDEEYVPGSGLLHYRMAGGEFATTEVTPVSGELFEAILPGAACGDVPEFYFSATGDGGSIEYYPEDAPAELLTTTVASITTIVSDNFESDQGWTVASAAGMDGMWERGNPVGDGSRGDPTDDCDGSGQCYLTGNEIGNSDVDGGPTILTSPVLDLTGWHDVVLRYGRWFMCDDTVPPAQDFLEVQVSIDDGATWSQLSYVASHNGWVHEEFHLADYVVPTAQCRLRFIAEDVPNDSVTEAGIDAVWIFDWDCADGLVPGDMNCDGSLNAFDIDPFVLALTDPAGYAAAYPDCDIARADINEDGVVNAFDIDPFVGLLIEP